MTCIRPWTQIFNSKSIRDFPCKVSWQSNFISFLDLFLKSLGSFLEIFSLDWLPSSKRFSYYVDFCTLLFSFTSCSKPLRASIKSVVDGIKILKLIRKNIEGWQCFTSRSLIFSHQDTIKFTRATYITIYKLFRLESTTFSRHSHSRGWGSEFWC